MSAYTAHDLSQLFEDKGYSGLIQFYSPSFEFTDSMKAGLKRIEREFEGQSGPTPLVCLRTRYDISKVIPMCPCSYKDEKFSIRLLDISYNNRAYSGEITRQLRKELGPEDIPHKQYQNDLLTSITTPADSEVKTGTLKDLSYESIFVYMYCRDDTWCCLWPDLE